MFERNIKVGNLYKRMCDLFDFNILGIKEELVIVLNKKGKEVQYLSVRGIEYMHIGSFVYNFKQIRHI